MVKELFFLLIWSSMTLQDRPDFAFSMKPDPSDEQVSVIIVHRDRPEYLNLCLQSIAALSSNNNYEMIVVDSGSQLAESQQLLDLLQSQGQVKVVKNKDNVFYPKALNQGVKVADSKSKYFIFMHHDVVILENGWMDLLMNISEQRDAGLVGVEIDAYMGDRQKMEFIAEYCMLVTRDCYQHCGPFAEDLPVLGSAFLFTMLAQVSNFNPQVVSSKILHHYQIFAFDASEFNRHSIEAKNILADHLRNIHGKLNKRYVPLQR